MNRDEFRAGVLEMVEEMKLQDGELTNLIAEGGELVAEAREHDPALADRLQAIVSAFLDLRAYVLSKSEGR